MAFENGNKTDGKHYWLIPPELYKELDQEFSFDFDPCPFPKPEDFDGLYDEWGQSNYVNPPFGSYIDQHDGKKKGPTAWAKKAIAEFKKGKQVVFLYPLDKWVLKMLEAGAKVRNMKDIKWHSTEDNVPGPGTGRHVACFILTPEDFDRTKINEHKRKKRLNQVVERGKQQRMNFPDMLNDVMQSNGASQETPNSKENDGKQIEK